MIALDAGLVIAHLQPHDVHHEAATTFLREHVDERLLIHPLSLGEVLVGGVRTGRGQELLADLQRSASKRPSRVTVRRCGWSPCGWNPG